MNCEVRYFTRSGNTKKLADAIGGALNVPVKSISEPVKEHADLLFLGGSVYGGGIDSALKTFIEGLKPELIDKVAVFSTAALLPSAYPEIKKHLEAQGIPVVQKEFHCRGKFALLHRSRPNQQDLNDVMIFAKELTAAKNN